MLYGGPHPVFEPILVPSYTSLPNHFSIIAHRYDSASRALDVTRKYIPDSDPRAGDKISLHELRASLARDPVKASSTVPIGMLGAKSLDFVGSVVSVNKEVEI